MATSRSFINRLDCTGSQGIVTTRGRHELTLKQRLLPRSGVLSCHRVILLDWLVRLLVFEQVKLMDGALVRPGPASLVYAAEWLMMASVSADCASFAGYLVEAGMSLRCNRCTA